MANYFNLAPDNPNAPWLPQYAAVALGVLVEPFLRDYIVSGHWHVGWGALLGRVAFALLMTIAILPSVYRNAFDPDKPVMIQLMALFPMGIGWRSVFDGLVKVAGADGAAKNLIG